MSQFFNNVFNYPTSASYFVQQQHAALQRQQQQKQIFQHQQQQPMLQQQQTQQSKNDTNQPQEKDKPKRDRWTEQNQILVSMYVENCEALESSNCNKVWPKKLESVCNYGPKKTLKQIKVKVRNMKDAYKKCKDENKKSGNNLHKCPFYEDFDQILSQRDVVNLPEFFEVGTVQKENQKFQELEEEKMMEMETLAKTRKRKCDFSSSEEENDEDDEHYEELKKDVTKKRSKKPNDKPKSFQEQLLAIQREQMNVFEKSERHFREFQQRMFEQQMEAEAREKEKDREFFLKFGAILTGKNDKKD